ncbi:helix-turn-helix transcriptional regulator [Flavobacterium sp. J49]|uniref:helix-turn-helix domain-containing protein n=1 Tax=Flavobacterium sp. J49 TaxID=2718534 RepID=UPI001594AF30|nr:helix-turn-helix transcriptional regulator [Flavobacterium sp. J49]MBF6642164.1 helix-turn-helix transcriptional regulator [Flavobacterium sp. J49]NIC03411.1 helix-turn-helix transcriptional regulator [Flavobacterium sp. J49]
MNQFVTIRQTLGLTQKELADILNISSKLLSQYENEAAVVPSELKQNLSLFYRYMKMALTYGINLNTIADYVAQRKMVEQLLQENKKQRDQVSSQLKKIQLSNKEELAKKKLLWLLSEDKVTYSFINYQKLEDCFQIPSESQETVIMVYKIKLSTLNTEKGRLESQWRVLQSNIEYLQSNPDVNAARELKLKATL